MSVSDDGCAGIRYLALGDSYTIGEGVDADQRWPVQLASALRECGWRIEAPHIVARTGWTSAELVDGLASAALFPPYGLVTLLVGVNDQYRGLPPEGYRREFNGLLGRAIALAGDQPERVVVVSIPDWGVTPFAAGRDRARIAAEIDLFNAINRKLAEQAGAGYADVTGLSRVLGGDADFMAADGLHPSGIQYGRWVELIAPRAEAAISIHR